MIRKPATQQEQSIVKNLILDEKRENKNIIDEIIAIRMNNLLRPNHLRDINLALQLYFIKHKQYPVSLLQLEEMPGFRTPIDPDGTSYFYSYFPQNKPTAYHLGALVEFEPALPINLSPEDLDKLKGTFVIKLDEDADFNSQNEKYANGFDGKDPILDMTAQNGGNVYGKADGLRQ